MLLQRNKLGSVRPPKRCRSDMDNTSTSDIVIINGNSHPDLANMVAERMGIKNGGCSVFHKSNRETIVEISDSVRGKDIYIIQTGTKDANNNIMELLIMAYACKTSSARSIVGVIPYLPYSKQCKMRKRGCIVSKLLAKMMCTSGLTHIITMDLHQKEIQGFFDIPVDNLRASPFLLQYIQESIPDYRNSVIVARNPGVAKKANSYAERLRLGLAVIHGEQKETDADEVDGRYSPPPTSTRQRTTSVSVGVPEHIVKVKPPLTIVGDVSGRIAIMVDDLIDDVQAFVAAAEMLKEHGACKIYVLATHGLLSSDAPRQLDESPIDEIVVTNTIPHEIQKLQCHKIKTIDISILIAEAIRRIHNKESMSYLFRNVTLED
ncbi:phosphoribosyl pyrophosphate synthase-associated protein 2 isoform X8 [Drosophila suzukii]|uniref:Phosphoribosyl pyrophosphate synthase-associated protein 2 isoform X8 n=1 Tax=Drosophila suzukii TaxID=28584 RepID=A0AB40AB95_DROSZ|nr:phosphoribosyl pyrophosphate synthase-associated protein 2 isoform X6 [Drosophila biarmipes]XP_036675285.1 phosphoribosyl pyrophosphate synthase-associated protein 2 isoform X6 [Drosophila suzukii]XP_037726693.1 phosphoribosyl pyrophosphate synthase-associated protein 2 isoform X6 [Drosophila subpulchrella]XP_052835743.1 phosphoribosyl pyrophosphate synthase-associated protein 2 isoform X8 [Drosophila gunungcola]